MFFLKSKKAKKIVPNYRCQIWVKIDDEKKAQSDDEWKRRRLWLPNYRIYRMYAKVIISTGISIGSKNNNKLPARWHKIKDIFVNLPGRKENAKKNYSLSMHRRPSPPREVVKGKELVCPTCGRQRHPATRRRNGAAQPALCLYTHMLMSMLLREIDDILLYDSILRWRWFKVIARKKVHLKNVMKTSLHMEMSCDNVCKYTVSDRL